MAHDLVRHTLFPLFSKDMYSLFPNGIMNLVLLTDHNYLNRKDITAFKLLVRAGDLQVLRHSFCVRTNEVASSIIFCFILVDNVINILLVSETLRSYFIHRIIVTNSLSRFKRKGWLSYKFTIINIL